MLKDEEMYGHVVLETRKQTNVIHISTLTLSLSLYSLVVVVVVVVVLVVVVVFDRLAILADAEEACSQDSDCCSGDCNTGKGKCKA